MLCFFSRINLHNIQDLLLYYSTKEDGNEKSKSDSSAAINSLVGLHLYAPGEHNCPGSGNRTCCSGCRSTGGGFRFC